MKEELENATGLNLQLPDAKLKDEKNSDKLSFYNQADKDSCKMHEALRNDPNYQDEDTGMNVLQLINVRKILVIIQYISMIHISLQ